MESMQSHNHCLKYGISLFWTFPGYKKRTRHKIRFHSLFICDSHIPRINDYAPLNLRPQVPWLQWLPARLRPPDSDPNFWNFIEEKP
jgi:hypothetical protein